MKICIIYHNERLSLTNHQKKLLKKIAIRMIKSIITIAIINGVLPFPVFASGMSDLINKGNSIKNIIWKIVLIVAHITFLAYGGKEVITNIINGDLKDAVKSVLKYAIGYYLLINFPKALDAMESF